MCKECETKKYIMRSRTILNIWGWILLQLIPVLSKLTARLACVYSVQSTHFVQESPTEDRSKMERKRKYRNKWYNRRSEQVISMLSLHG
jgi:hypothetical protein